MENKKNRKDNGSSLIACNRFSFSILRCFRGFVKVLVQPKKK
jgi:hypothetical protein